MSISKQNQIEISRKLFESFSITKKQKIQPFETESPRSLIIEKLNYILQNEAKSKNLEISIFNWALQYIKNNKIKASSNTNKVTKKTIYYNNELNWNNNRLKRVYLSKYRSISFNLKNTNNVEFKENILNNVIQIKTIVNMKPQEIYPAVWEKVFQNRIKKEMMRLKNEGKELELAVEGQYTCSKCKCKKITYYELQTRSADEPMTAYFTCLNCQHHWKE